MKPFLIGEFHFNKIIKANMLFIVINGVFAFLFLNLPFVPSFFLLFTFCENKYRKYLRKVINIRKIYIKYYKVYILYQIVC